MRNGLDALEPRNGAQLVECIDHIFLVRTAHHGHNYATRHREGHQDERGFVTHPARGIFVDLWLGNMRKIDDLARQHHFLRENRCLLRGHVGKIDRHQERRQLVLWHFSIQRGINDIANLLLAELPPIALLLDQIAERGLDEPARWQGAFSHVTCHGTCWWPLAI